MPTIKHNTTNEILIKVNLNQYDIGNGIDQWSIIADPIVNILVEKQSYNGTWSRISEKMTTDINIGDGVHGLRNSVGNSSIIDLAITSTNLSTLVAANGRIDYLPFNPGRDLSINKIGVDCSTVVVGGQIRLGIYSAGVLGVPFNKIAESSILDCSTANAKDWLPQSILEFEKGGLYWLAIHQNSATMAFRALPIASMIPISPPAIGAAAFNTIRRTTNATFSSGLPPVAQGPSLVNSVGVHFRMTLAK